MDEAVPEAGVDRRLAPTRGPFSGMTWSTVKEFEQDGLVVAVRHARSGRYDRYSLLVGRRTVDGAALSPYIGLMQAPRMEEGTLQLPYAEILSALLMQAQTWVEQALATADR